MLIRPAAGALSGLLAAMIIAGCSTSSGGDGTPAAGTPAASSPESTAGSTTGSTAGSTTGATSPRAPSTPIPPVATPVVPAGNDILGPTGWQTLQLGMAPAVAEATGIFTETPALGGTGCVDWFAAGAAAIDSATVSANLGVVAITVDSVDSVLMTPEGMALGWTVAQVHAAYPSFPIDAEASPSGPPTIPVPQNAEAIYRIRLQVGVVIAITLESLRQDCFD